MAYATYSAVTPVGTENPMKLKWYEKSGTVYFRSTDTSVVAGKTYYSKGGGHLIKIGKTSSSINYEIPRSFIKAETFSALWSTTDVDSFRNGDGTLVRNTVLPNKVLKVEFQTPDMDSEDFEAVMSEIRSRYIDSTEKDLYVEAWVGELGVYKSDKCYVPDITTPIRFADNGELRYSPVTLKFIGYSTSSAT